MLAVVGSGSVSIFGSIFRGHASFYRLSTCFIGCMPNVEARSWQAEANTAIIAPCGRLRSFAAATEGRAELTTNCLGYFPLCQLLHVDYMRKFTSNLTAMSRDEGGTWPPPSRMDFGRFCCTCSSLPDMSWTACPFTYPHNYHRVTVSCC